MVISEGYLIGVFKHSVFKRKICDLEMRWSRVKSGKEERFECMFFQN